MIKYGLLTAEDEMASEFEVYDFLYGLVRLLKPKLILETGTYKGGATKRMAQALLDNGFGVICTCETDEGLLREAWDWRRDFGEVIEPSYLEGEKAARSLHSVDLAFIDSSGDRVAEVAALQLAPGGVVVLHDSNRPQYKPIWTLRPWKTIWHIPTEQGITVFQS